MAEIKPFVFSRQCRDERVENQDISAKRLLPGTKPACGHRVHRLALHHGGCPHQTGVPPPAATPPEEALDCKNTLIYINYPFLHGAFHFFTASTMKNFVPHVLVLTLGLVAFASPAHAANQTWNPGGAGGGAGIWSGSNWGSEAAWVAGNTAVFDGTAGAVTVGMQTAGGLTFNTSGYKLAAPGTLTLAGAPVVLKLGQGVTATFDVGLLPAGAGGLRLCLMGGGTLSLTTDARRTLGTAANPAIWTVTGSTLAFTSGDNLGAAPFRAHDFADPRQRHDAQHGSQGTPLLPQPAHPDQRCRRRVGGHRRRQSVRRADRG